MSVPLGEVRCEGDEESEDRVSRTGEVVAASPRSDELAKEGDEGGEDAGTLGELGVVVADLLVLGLGVCEWEE